ncbi:copper-transporting ATPase (plasmid) [Cellulomonas sp. WB94]|nr:copper-transporting ATPase [Cellulomonas sp. WB94]
MHRETARASRPKWSPTVTTATTYDVAGMTCEHCVRAITTEVSALGSVDDVAVDLPQGRVTVISTAPLELATVRAAIDAAGYELTGVHA